MSESEIINVDDLSCTSGSENDETISDDWSDISDVAVEIETLKKGKKNSDLVDDLSSFSESENDEIITDDWSDISDVAVEIETPKKGK